MCTVIAMPEVIHPADESQLIARAVRAWGLPTVLIREATVQQLAGRRYVVLPRDGCAPVVYRIDTNGALRQMLRPPSELTAGYDQ